FAAATYKRNLGVDVAVADLNQLPPRYLREKLGLERGEFSVLMGGPPCQGFSKMRNSNGNGDSRNLLVLRYLEFVDEFRPRFALMENVPGLVQSGHGREFFQALLDGLARL